VRLLAGLLGVGAVTLGGLWLLQGLDLVRIRPLLCFADCAVLHGGSVLWTITGACVFGLGVAAIVFALRRRRPAGPS
jgi:hypothetical protein